MRSYNRFKTDQEIACNFDGESHRVGLYNLSCGGCMIEAATLDAVVGKSVTIGLNAKIKVPGHIVWRVDKNAGVKFDIPVHQKVVEHFGYLDETFDANDPRDRFGIPLVEIRTSSAGAFD